MLVDNKAIHQKSQGKFFQPRIPHPTSHYMYRLNKRTQSVLSSHLSIRWSLRICSIIIREYVKKGRNTGFRKQSRKAIMGIHRAITRNKCLKSNQSSLEQQWALGRFQGGRETRTQ